MLRQSYVWVLIIFFTTSIASAFDLPKREKSFIHSKYLTLGIGSGSIGFSNQEGISGHTGFSINVTAGHYLNQYFQVQFKYQFSNFDLTTPDILNPSNAITTNASMNQELIQLLIHYPKYFIQPYLAVGIGGYSWTGVNRETTLSFPIDLFLPVGAGLKTYFVKDLISFDAEYSYHFMFGENQDADTLSLLGINKVGFDTYHLTGTFTFYLF